jgi:hypothetical protein
LIDTDVTVLSCDPELIPPPSKKVGIVVGG